MQSKQLEPFKHFMLAEERNDTHTSTCAMKLFSCQEQQSDQHTGVLGRMIDVYWA
jgi:hypothetical protein